MVDTTKLTVQEIRDILTDEYSYDQNTVNGIKGKAKLVERLLYCQGVGGDETQQGKEPMVDITQSDIVIQDALNELTVEEDIPIFGFETSGQEPKATEGVVIGCMPEFKHNPWDAPDWTEQVMEMLTDDEKRDGNPTVDGLRRVAGNILGRIVEIDPRVLQCPDHSNNNRATVKVTVEFDTPEGRLKVGACADVFCDNTEPIFARHPVATADSRAEGRAYRKALRLRNTITAEESVKEDELREDPFDKIKDTQKSMITAICKRYGINEEKFVKQYDVDISKIDNITYATAKKMCSQLNKYQQSLVDIPEEIKNES
jgi:hypothetical protein